MQLSNERIQEFKDIIEEKGKKVSWEEATEGANNLARFAELLYDQAHIEYQREEKLKKYPKGFHIDGEGYMEGTPFLRHQFYECVRPLVSFSEGC